MRKLIEGFPDQLKDAQRIAQAAVLQFDGFVPNHVLALGMGGSGISGAIASGMLARESCVPMTANTDYSIPTWVGPSTLVIACSYSGNTEETLSALDAAVKAGARIAAVTGGGELKKRADSAGWPTVVIPGGQPPRSQFGYAFMGLATVLQAAGVAPERWGEELAAATAGLEQNQPNIIERATSLAGLLGSRQAMLYGDVASEGVLVRWRQQLNENSKRLVSHHVFPEMNHNELVGWEQGGEDRVVILFHCPGDHPRTRKRMEIAADIFQEQGADVVVVEPNGDTAMERLFDLVHLGDWLSLLLAEADGIDPIDIRYIDRLKGALAQFTG
jgi:glucose/mannose-6-phosphate isomerase